MPYNTAMPTTDLDQLMDQASLKLVKMQYLEAEALCEQALQMAYDRKLWGYFARITLPLQECRRQRRMIAAEGTIVLGTDHLGDDPIPGLDQLTSGCVVFTGPQAIEQARVLLRKIQAKPRHLLVLATTTGQTSWHVQSANAPMLTVDFPAPPADWQHQTLAPVQWPEPASPCNWPTPGDWVLDAMEQLGDTAIKTIESSADDVNRVDALLAALQAVPDHEILHQLLAKAANAMVR